MGKQRSKALRRRAEELYEKFKDKFSTDFEKNKRSLDEMKMFQSKLVRNIVAGYLVKLAEGQVL